MGKVILFIIAIVTFTSCAPTYMVGDEVHYKDKFFFVTEDGQFAEPDPNNGEPTIYKHMQDAFK